jgi:hypothetical protein
MEKHTADCRSFEALSKRELEIVRPLGQNPGGKAGTHHPARFTMWIYPFSFESGLRGEYKFTLNLFRKMQLVLFEPHILPRAAVGVSTSGIIVGRGALVQHLADVRVISK